MPKMRQSTEEKFLDSAQKLCIYWQQILGLQHWEVEVRVVRHFDLDKGDVASISTFPEKYYAVLELLHPGDRNPAGKPDYPVEVDIVHELTHLHFGGRGDYGNDALRIAEEQAVHAISLGFWKLSGGEAKHA